MSHVYLPGDCWEILHPIAVICVKNWLWHGVDFIWINKSIILREFKAWI